MGRIFCLSLVFLCSLQVWSQAPSPGQYQLKDVGYSGNGCPQGSVAISLAPDSSAVSFLFSQYQIEIPRQGRSNRSCTLKITLVPPESYQLRVFRVDYRGFNSLPRGSNSTLSSEISQATKSINRRAGRSRFDFRGPLTQDFAVTATAHEGIWTKCTGEPLEMNLTTQIEVQNPSFDLAQMTVDSADATTAGATFYLGWVRCSNEQRQRDRDDERKREREQERDREQERQRDNGRDRSRGRR